MNSYYNNPNNLYNLVLEFSKFSRSPVQVERVSETNYDFSIGSVPFFEFEFGRDYTASLFKTFKNMTIVYGSLLKLTTDFEIALKFIATYGPSKYITVTGGRGTETGLELQSMRSVNTSMSIFVIPISWIHRCSCQTSAQRSRSCSQAFVRSSSWALTSLTDLTNSSRTISPCS